MLKKYTDISIKVCNSIKKELDYEPISIYIKKVLKTKIRSYSNEAAESNYDCWLVTLIDSVLQKDENYYLQVILKELKYIENERKVIRYINDDLKFSDHSDESYEK